MNILTLINKDLRLFFKSKGTVVLAYLVPIVISLIFGLVFGGFGTKSGMREIRVLAVDADNSELSQKLLAELDNLEEIRILTKITKGEEKRKMTLDEMDNLIKIGQEEQGIYIPKDFEKELFSQKKPLEIRYDPKYQIEFSILNGILQKLAFQKFPNLLIDKMWNLSEQYLGKTKGDAFKSGINAQITKFYPQTNEQNSSDTPDSLNIFSQSIIPISSQKLVGNNRASGKSFYFQYIAGMAVMFLLFSVASNGASLIKEKHDGTLKRLLTAPIKDYEILLGKLFYSSFTGVTQLIVLFLFGWLVFGLDIFSRPFAIIILMLFTSFACSALGILLATICKNESQVSSISTLLILGMSALGGSMFPSFIMPSYLKLIGKFTLNYWAMDGFTTIFWRELGLKHMIPNLAVLGAISIIFTLIALFIYKKNKINIRS